MGKATASKSRGIVFLDAVISLIREIADARAKVLEAKPKTEVSGFDIVNRTRYHLDIEVIGNKIVVEEELR